MAVKRLAVKTKAPLGTEEKVDSTLIKTEEVKTESTSTFNRKIGTDPSSEPVKDLENSLDTIPISVGMRKVGVSRGLTINLKNYESAKVSYWMERVILDNDDVAKKAICDMTLFIDNFLESDLSDINNK